MIDRIGRLLTTLPALVLTGCAPPFGNQPPNAAPSSSRSTVRGLEQAFGSMTHAKGYRVLKHVRVIQGDGITAGSICAMLATLKAQGCSADGGLGLSDCSGQERAFEPMRRDRRLRRSRQGRECPGSGTHPSNAPSASRRLGFCEGPFRWAS